MTSTHRSNQCRQRDAECVSDSVQRADLRCDSTSFYLDDRLAVDLGSLGEPFDGHAALPSETCDLDPKGAQIWDRSRHILTVAQARSVHSNLNAPI